MFFVSSQPPDGSGRIPMGAQGPFPLGGASMRNMFGTRFVPDESLTPPDAIQSLIDGEEGSVVACGHCRQPGAALRCGRCKCVKYCGTDCQKLHFATHKKNCKAVKKQRDVVEALFAQCADPGSNFSTVTEMIKLGNLLIEVGYQESDTVANGRLYYREALKAFTQPMMVYKNSYHHALSISVEDKVLLMIVALGGDDRAIKAWCEESGITGENPDPHDPNRVLTDETPRSVYFQSVSGASGEESDESFAAAEELGVSLRGLAQDDVTFQVIHLFSLMKSLAAYRQNVERLGTLEDEMSKEMASNAPVYDISKAVFPYLGRGEKGEEELSAEIQSVIGVIRHFDNEDSLLHLRDSIPLREEDAPKLFRPGVHTGDTVGRECLWMILQDLFFETPGVSNLLSEFLPEEDWDNVVD